jgi:hypothetical protein
MPVPQELNAVVERASSPFYNKRTGKMPVPLILNRVHLGLENISVGAKHDRCEYEMITNNLYAVMLRPLQKPDAPY